MRRIAFALGLAALAANAQNNPAVSQTDAVRQQRQVENTFRDLKAGDDVPSLYSEEDADLGPQSVLRKRKHRWFRVSADEQVYYTDNMFFVRDGDIDAGVSVATLEAALQTPPCLTRFASYRAEVGYRHQFFNYFGDDEPVARLSFFRLLDRNDFDFGASTAFAEIQAQTAHYQFRFGFDYMRLIGDERIRGGGTDEDAEFYREFVPRWSVQRNFRICDRSQVSIAYLGSYHFTKEPELFVSIPGGGFARVGLDDRSERWEHAAVAAYSMALPADLVVQPYYRFQYTDFTSLPFSAENSECLQTVGVGLGWYPCANFSARVFANYNWNESDVARRDYEQSNAGGGVNVTLRF
jgi:hypothetical protein